MLKTISEGAATNKLTEARENAIDQDSFGFRHGLMLLWFTDLMNVTEEVTIHRPNVSTLLSGAFIRGDLIATTRDPFIWLLSTQRRP